MCEDQALRIKKLEDALARQAAVIDALNRIVANTLVAHAMSTGDLRPLSAIRECAEFDEKRVHMDGTTRNPKEFFEARCEAFASVLQKVFETELASRYWVRSAWEWLDNRRHDENLRMRKKIDRLANWPS